METKGGVTRSRDSKDFFEEKQLVTLRPNTRWRAIAKHANLQRLMPRTDVHWPQRWRLGTWILGNIWTLGAYYVSMGGLTLIACPADVTYGIQACLID
ncbi:hypothetical protein NDU88_005573 [Pleurodeles waltl]|uniref:Uncharacterized protein n=1 Tax=Pleurodeles waltl TaxID=8319 RepID=A0AAV7NVN3_PLEWA|nr:hypothetical protein NDU88_005573 [Pleurodeles waltl]